MHGQPHIRFIVLIGAVCSSPPQELNLELWVKLSGAERRERHPCTALEQMARSITQLQLLSRVRAGSANKLPWQLGGM